MQRIIRRSDPCPLFVPFFVDADKRCDAAVAEKHVLACCVIGHKARLVAEEHYPTICAYLNASSTPDVIRHAVVHTTRH